VPHNKTPKEIEDRIVKAISGGMSVHNACLKFKVCRHTCRTIIKKHGIKEIHPTKKCEWCEGEFETSKCGNKASRIQRFCSDQCRVEAYAFKKSRAYRSGIKSKQEAKDARAQWIKMHPESTCVICDKPFFPFVKIQKTCGNLKCSSKHSRRLKAPKIKGPCKVCGETWTGRSNSRVFCSKKCVTEKERLRAKTKSQAKAIKKICKSCGEEFTTTSKLRKHCHRKCTNNWRQNEQAAREHEALVQKRIDQGYKVVNNGTQLIATCEICGEDFTTRHLGPMKFCSKKCRSANSSKKNVEKYHKKHNITIRKFDCPICKKSITSTMPRQKTCGSSSCNFQLRQLKNRGNLVELKKDCLFCGNEFSFIGREKNTSYQHRYCSEKCSTANNYENNRANHAARAKKYQQTEKGIAQRKAAKRRKIDNLTDGYVRELISQDIYRKGGVPTPEDFTPIKIETRRIQVLSTRGKLLDNDLSDKDKVKKFEETLNRTLRNKTAVMPK
jgi:hypothetical protein